MFGNFIFIDALFLFLQNKILCNLGSFFSFETNPIEI